MRRRGHRREGILDRADGALAGIGRASATGDDVGHLAAHAGIPGDLYGLLDSFDGLNFLVARMAGVHRVVSGGDATEVDDLIVGGHTLPRGLKAGRVAEGSGFETFFQGGESFG